MANLTAAANPELVLEMEAMDRTTPAHCDEWNRRYQQFLDNDKFLHKQMENVFVNNAGAHNSIYRGKNLTKMYTIDEICKHISSGTFEDLYVGDYFDVSITTSLGGTETVRLIMAGFDLLLNKGHQSSLMKKHHAIMVPRGCFRTRAKMNDTNDVTGGYAGTKMNTEVLPVYGEALQAALDNHIIKYKSMLTTSVSETGSSNAGAGKTGYANNSEWKDVMLRLMSEIQLYGCNVFSSSFYDTGEANIQFPLFKMNPGLLVSNLGFETGENITYWLSAVACSGAFACCMSGGNSSFMYPSYDGGVRPYFCVG